VAGVLLLNDWSPVDVVLSIVRLERPRRSMSGAKVEVDPVTEFVLLAVEPVTEDCEVAEEPVTAALVPAVALFTEAEAEGDVAWLSGMQSWWTGLDDFSFAMPVDLSASLPAFGLFNWLHRGFAAVVAELVAARAGVAASTAAAMRLRVKFGFIR